MPEAMARLRQTTEIPAASGPLSRRRADYTSVDAGFRYTGLVARGPWSGVMEQPVRPEGASPTTPEPGPPSPHLLSRDYEDHLDWLENQRRDRTRRGRRLGFGVVAAVAAAFTFAGTMLRRR